jgi:diguanylate cyclase (GGDEF)-like protein/PAS domain S-box-containing protein
LENQHFKILLADNSPEEVGLLKGFLSLERNPSFAVENTPTLQGCLEQLTKKKFDVLLLDLSLPDSHGLQTLAKVRNHSSTLPIVILVSPNEEQLAAETVKNGAQDFLVKGQIDARILSRVIHYAVENKQAEETVQASKEYFQALIENALDIITVLNGNGIIRYESSSIERALGYKQDELIGKYAFEYVHPDDLQQVIQTFTRVTETPNLSQSTEFRFRHRDGSWRTLASISKNLLDHPTVQGIVVNSRDITERKTAEEALAEQAVRDSLTNLYNRRYFNHRAEEEIAQADRNKQILAILLCDLDHFKTINDTRGHQSGDEVLKAVAKNIKNSTRGTDLVFRWGGDEFVIILSNTSRDGVLHVGERIRRGIHTVSQHFNINLDLSIGAVLYPEHGLDIDELIRLADRALYISKKGQDKIHIGEEEYHLDEHSVRVVFQPIMDVESNQAIGYEALSRDPQGKLSILDLFNKYNAVGQLNELKRLCFITQLKLAQRLGLTRVFLNVDFNMLSQFASLPKDPAMEVVLEISEMEVVTDVENKMKLVQKLRGQGYKFAIDDFGAGFISLPFVTQLIPDYIKIDRASILQAVSSDQFKLFLKDLVLALRNYSKEGIIAEGIETQKELDLIKETGISLMQGFVFGQPQELTQKPT